MHIQPLVLQILTVILPVVALFLPATLKQDRLTPGSNGWIAFFVVVALSGAQAWAAGQLGANPLYDMPIIIVAIFTLLNGPLKSVDQYIQSNVGFGVVKPTQSVQTVAVSSPAEIAVLANAAMSIITALHTYLDLHAKTAAPVPMSSLTTAIQQQLSQVGPGQTALIAQTPLDNRSNRTVPLPELPSQESPTSDMSSAVTTPKLAAIPHS